MTSGKNRRIYLARHGETEWNALSKLQGATDVPLNDTGRAQARALGERLRGEGITEVATSDLSRAKETGAIAAQVLGLGLGDAGIPSDPELRERSFGIFEGLTRTEIEARYPAEWQDWQVRAISPPKAEASELVVARMRRALTRIFAREGNGTTLVVSHGGAMRLLLNDLTSGPIPPIGNGHVYKFTITDDMWNAEAWRRLET